MHNILRTALFCICRTGGQQCTPYMPVQNDAFPQLVYVPTRDQSYSQKKLSQKPNYEVIQLPKLNKLNCLQTKTYPEREKSFKKDKTLS